MVTSTVLSYLNDEHCLIMVVCSAYQDMETCLTMKHVKETGATERCIGVLTKADMLPSGKMKDVREMLKGGKHTLGKGWYIVAQPSQQDIDAGDDRQLDVKREKDLFATGPWLDTPGLRSRYGTAQLRQEIARTLADKIMAEYV